ncbi:transcriptional regulator GcvA [Azospirillum picis]|uniref:LysR family glycine cleavage system transcriptional activator/LysR family transcriptional regulator of beta-lactamase n=1 Tax=Azospirillum picis TaxID=488438 RepID=A0ABU0MCQ3_9PROT|nr:transcriptional regulator GcvA [Azospirillum picis]MBP2297773.1 LysR family glycine cleavage system transcriptional activator/LysR family transcriptional regulator of beta-lactamase [Azospirillum picis]MDQ0531204.1 LysR family glycine cleavage system transcriptional activator/LysR family transcriptional regulator of beta-lactamase [Azospirillum picis]
MRRLPSLNGLRAFEAAARHGSFTAAAAELHVSQAAVSRMVRLLEERLGFALFDRRANALALTERGRSLRPALTEAFDAIARQVEQVSAMRAGPVLTVGMGATVAVRWLIPRLSGFHIAHPEIEVRIATGGAGAPMNDDWTCAVLLGDGQWPGYEAERLFSSTMLPVCAPRLAADLREPADLAAATLLHVSHWAEDWPRWLAAAGADPTAAQSAAQSAAKSLSFGSYAMTLQAAIDGIGVALTPRIYIQDDIAAGRLVAPFGLAVPMSHSWYLVHRASRRQDGGFPAFRAWLHALCRETA